MRKSLAKWTETTNPSGCRQRRERKTRSVVVNVKSLGYYSNLLKREKFLMFTASTMSADGKQGLSRIIFLKKIVTLYDFMTRHKAIC